MTSPDALIADGDRLALQSAGALAEIVSELDALQVRLASLSDWQPAVRLQAELAWARAQIERLAAAWGSKLVVVLAGPSGAGKSTLLNALAGREVSPTGLARPTTRGIVAYVAHEADVQGLRARWGQTDVSVQAEPEALGLAHLVLVDAPDTNTTTGGLAALARVLDSADVLVAVFSAHNPRLHDNLAFLAPYVRQMPPASVAPVINMVDRAPLDELRATVAPDLAAALAREWGLEAPRIYLVSARASLPNAAFAADEAPLHALNEFDALRAWLFESLNRASQVVDRRLARARRLVELVQGDLQAAATARRAPLQEAQRLLERFGQAVAAALTEALRQRAGSLRGLDLHAALYGRLTARWWGPLGWVVAVWGALVRAAAWVSRLGARGRLSLAGGGDVELALDLGSLDETLESAYAERWPPVADALAAAGFEGLRERRRWLVEAQAARERLQQQSAQAIGRALDDSARRLAHPLLQLLFNAPVLGLLGWTGYRAVAAFVTGQFLPSAYFQNAGVALLSVWAGCFVLLQVLVSLTVRWGLRRRTARALADAASWRLADELQAQLDLLLR
jgi:energy-coupling factor transporter ATP-binding protein EcfA2